MNLLKLILKTIIILGASFFPEKYFSQLKKYPFEEIENLQKNHSRNVVIFIHADWCQYCKTMQNTTFKNEKIINLLNEKFYFTELDAEEKRDITFFGKTFRYKPNGKSTGIHELAETLGNIHGKVSYPSIIILNPENEIIFQYDGFLNTEHFLQLLIKLINK